MEGEVIHHNIAPQLAYENDFQIIVIRKSWTCRVLKIKQSISYPTIRTFFLLSIYSTRPRALTHLKCKSYAIIRDLWVPIYPLRLMVVSDSGQKLRALHKYHTLLNSFNTGNDLAMLLKSINDFYLQEETSIYNVLYES